MSMAEVYRFMAKNPGVPFREACRICGRAASKRRGKGKQGKRPKGTGPKTRARKREVEEAERQRRYVEGLEKRGLF